LYDLCCRIDFGCCTVAYDHSLFFNALAAISSMSRFNEGR
jgi:hypothetical protein